VKGNLQFMVQRHDRKSQSCLKWTTSESIFLINYQNLIVIFVNVYCCGVEREDSHLILIFGLEKHV
jgi:hypothetical protein